MIASLKSVRVLLSLGSLIVVTVSSASALPRELRRAIEDDCPRLVSALPALSPQERRELRDRFELLLKLNIPAAAEVAAPQTAEPNNYLGLWKSFDPAPVRTQLECLMTVAGLIPETMVVTLPGIVELSLAPTVAGELSERLDQLALRIADSAPRSEITPAIVGALWSIINDRSIGLVAAILIRLPSEARNAALGRHLAAQQQAVWGDERIRLFSLLDPTGSLLAGLVQAGANGSFISDLLSKRLELTEELVAGIMVTPDVDASARGQWLVRILQRTSLLVPPKQRVYPEGLGTLAAQVQPQHLRDPGSCRVAAAVLGYVRSKGDMGLTLISAALQTPNLGPDCRAALIHGLFSVTSGESFSPAQRRVAINELKVGSGAVPGVVLSALAVLPALPKEYYPSVASALKSNAIADLLSEQRLRLGQTVLQPADFADLVLRELAAHPDRKKQIGLVLSTIAPRHGAVLLEAATARGVTSEVQQLLREYLPIAHFEDVLRRVIEVAHEEGHSKAVLETVLPAILELNVSVAGSQAGATRKGPHPLTQLVLMLKEPSLTTGGREYLSKLSCRDLPMFGQLSLGGLVAVQELVVGLARNCLASQKPGDGEGVLSLVEHNEGLRAALSTELTAYLEQLPTSVEATLWQIRLFDLLRGRGAWSSELGGRILRNPELLIAAANTQEQALDVLFELDSAPLMARSKFILAENPARLGAFERALIDFVLRRSGEDPERIEVIKRLAKVRDPQAHFGERDMPAVVTTAQQMALEGSTSERSAAYAVLGRYALKTTEQAEFLVTRWKAEPFGRAKMSAGIAALLQLPRGAVRTEIEAAIEHSRGAWDLGQERTVFSGS